MKILKLKNDKSRPPNFTGKVIWDNGTQAYYKEGCFHREDGPAIIYNSGAKLWYINCKDVSHGGKKEDWFELLTPEQKVAALFNEENW